MVLCNRLFKFIARIGSKKMGYLLYRILEKRKFLLKVILLIGLISLSSMVFIFPSQLSTPHILSKYFKNYVNYGVISIDKEDLAFEEESDNPMFDFILDHGHANSPQFIEDFSQILNDCSINTFDIFEPLSFSLMSYEYIIVNNFTENKGRRVLGLNTDQYNEINSLTNGSNPSGAIIFSYDNNVTLGSYNVSFYEQNASLAISKYILAEEFQKNFPYLNEYLVHGSKGVNLTQLIFLPINDFITFFEPLISFYLFEGYIKFSQYQQDVIYWSINSVSLISKFKEDIIASIQSAESSFVTYDFRDNIYLAQKNAFIVNIVFSFIRAIQLLIWILSGIIVIFAIAKIQRSNVEKELRIVFAGTSWLKRISSLTFESLLITIGSTTFAYLIIWPLIKLQSLFGINLSFNKSVILGITIYPAILFLLIGIVNLDFEFHLRRLIRNGLSSEEYKPFSKIPIYIKFLGIFLILLLVYVLNKTFISILYQIGIFLIAAFICFVLFLLIKISLKVITSLIYRRKKRKDKPLTKFHILYNLWKKPLFTKIFIYSFIFLVISSLFLYSVTTSEFLRTDYKYMQGGEINIYTNNLSNTTQVDVFLQNNSEIIDYTTILRTQGNLSNDLLPDFAYSNIFGIDKIDYFDFFRFWNKKTWLSEGQIENFDKESIFVSTKFKDVGYELGDSVQLSTNQTFTIRGFVNNWPGISNSHKTKRIFIVIFDNQALYDALESLGEESFSYNFKVHVAEEEIITTVTYLIDHLRTLESFHELTALDPYVFEGIKIVFIFPIILLFETLFILIVALFIYTNLDDIHSSLEAKTLGFISMVTDYRKPVFWYKLLEFSIIFGFSLTLFLLIFTSTALFLPIIADIPLSEINFSSKTILYSVILLSLYPALLLLQNIFEYFNNKRIKIHLLYRHPE